ncbi:MAG: hypothetical protein ACR2IF_16260 [Terriglobales bacterium]
MQTSRGIVVAAVLASVLGLGGCSLRKKKPATPAPQAQAPTVTEPQPAPPSGPVPAPSSSEPNRPQPETPAAAAPTVTPAKPKPKPRTSVAKKTPPPAPSPAPATEKPARTVVPEGGAQPSQNVQLSASLPHDAAIHQKLSTAQLLETTEYNLKSISRALNGDEQAMVQHIRSYMQQSRDASKDGDSERAYNLAMKAHLLSDELVKR